MYRFILGNNFISQNISIIPINHLCTLYNFYLEANWLEKFQNTL